jgi:hypothetical protein
MRGARNIGRPPAAPQHIVFERPGERRFGIRLDVARQYGVAAAAHGHVQRRPRPARVRQRSSESDLLDEPLGVEHGLDRTRVFAAPARVAVLLDADGKLSLRFHRHVRCVWTPDGRRIVVQNWHVNSNGRRNRPDKNCSGEFYVFRKTHPSNFYLTAHARPSGPRS